MSLVKDARRKGTVKYERHKPEQTLLYQIIKLSKNITRSF
jgi:hypothetical protein